MLCGAATPASPGAEPHQRSKPNTGLMVGLAVGVVGAIFLVFWSSRSHPAHVAPASAASPVAGLSEPAPASPEPPTGLVRPLGSGSWVPPSAEPSRDDISTAEAMVRKQAKDPSSVQFRNEMVVGNMVCGEVNGKNSFGGYTGFQFFVYQKGAAGAVIEPEEGGLSGDNLAAFCQAMAR
jgi:hypothetical protein